jgi:hypothetical protein
MAKESPNLELRLQRYGEKKFRDLFVIFGKWLGVFLEIFLKIRGASCKYVGCGLILDKMRGQSAKCWEMGFSWNYFVEEKPVDQFQVDRVARSTMDRRPLPHAGAHRSSAFSRSGALELRPRGRGGRGKHGGPDSGLTGAQKAVEQRHDDGEGGGGGALDAGSLRAWREGKEGWGRSGCRVALLEGRRGSGAAGHRRGTGGGGGAPKWQ